MLFQSKKKNINKKNIYKRENQIDNKYIINKWKSRLIQ
jgi:hypothetical protein